MAAVDLDFLALSFVRRASDVQKLREMLIEKGSSIPIISKIEKPRAVDDVTQILQNSWGAMVARGDLGVDGGLWIERLLPLVPRNRACLSW